MYGPRREKSKQRLKKSRLSIKFADQNSPRKLPNNHLANLKSAIILEKELSQRDNRIPNLNASIGAQQYESTMGAVRVNGQKTKVKQSRPRIILGDHLGSIY